MISMPNVQWVKLSTEMFDNPKIKYIRTLPEGNNMLLIWIMLISKAGICNASGYIFLTDKVPYTTKMLADEFKFDELIVKLALDTFSRLNMIELEEQNIYIIGWAEHQNTDGLDKIKEQSRKRSARYREKQKILQLENKENEENDVTRHVTSRDSHAIEEEKEEDKEIEKDKKKDNTSTKVDVVSILTAWNNLSSKNPTIPEVMKLTQNRLSKLKRRISEYGSEKVLQAILNIEQSEFLMGDNNRGWVIDFSWFIESENFLKVLEGKYTTKTKKKSSTSTKNNAFTTTYSHNWDLNELEKREREYIENKIYGEQEGESDE